jgi:acid phosphatase family membrane protein YuiD
MSNSVLTILRNASFWSAMAGWTSAQTIKVLRNLRRTGRVDFRYLASLGGMPSAHTAGVTALATSLGIDQGFGSPVFVLALAFAVFVMFDASTVRRAAGLQARLLNEILDELFQEHHLSQRKLRELLGHTRTEVFAGMVLGIAVALLVNAAAGRLSPEAG